MVATTSPTTRAICMRLRLVDFDRVDHAHDRRVDRAVLEAGRHPRRAAADDEDRLADAGVHGVHGDEVRALEFSGRIDGPRNKKLRAFEPLVLAGGDDGPDDSGEEHWCSGRADRKSTRLNSSH